MLGSISIYESSFIHEQALSLIAGQNGNIDYVIVVQVPGINAK